MRAVVGGNRLIKLARPIGDVETLDVTVNRALSMLDGFELASVEVFADGAETPPGTEIEIGTMEQIKIAELAEIGRHVVLSGKDKEAPSAHPP